MKRVTLLMLVLGLCFNAKSQTCVPMEGLPDTLVGVVPFPYVEETMSGGISDTACLNTYFEFTFTIVVPETFPVSGVDVPLESIEFATEGALTGIPDEFDYICNPPDCIFPKDSTGCVLLFGTPDDPEDVGVWDMVIAGTIRTPLIDLELTFPNEDLFPGNYLLTVKEEGDPNCLVISTEDAIARKVSINNAPNPFSGNTQIFINSEVSDNFTFQVHDLLGKQLHQERLQIIEGENRIDFDGSFLANGVYIYSVSNGKDNISKKMVVNR